MSKYLFPNEEYTISEQKNIFEIRNKMTDIPSNFCSKENNISKCFCNKKEDIEHIYYCVLLNKEHHEIKFEQIYSDNLIEQKKVLNRFEKNMERRNEFKNISYKEESEPNHGIQLDPLSSVLLEHSNG